jgi:hypothetical protein
MAQYLCDVLNWFIPRNAHRILESETSVEHTDGAMKRDPCRNASPTAPHLYLRPGPARSQQSPPPPAPTAVGPRNSSCFSRAPSQCLAGASERRGPSCPARTPAARVPPDAQPTPALPAYTSSRGLPGHMTLVSFSTSYPADLVRMRPGGGPSPWPPGLRLAPPAARPRSLLSTVPSAVLTSVAPPRSSSGSGVLRPARVVVLSSIPSAERTRRDGAYGRRLLAGCGGAFCSCDPCRAQAIRN